MNRGRSARFEATREVRPAAVGDLLGSVLDELGVSEKVNECRALLAWEHVAGSQLSERAKAVRVRHGRLELEVPSAVWRTHLSFSKQQLLTRLNDQLGCRIVRDLVFVNRQTPKS